MRRGRRERERPSACVKSRVWATVKEQPNLYKIQHNSTTANDTHEEKTRMHSVARQLAIRVATSYSSSSSSSYSSSYSSSSQKQRLYRTRNSFSFSFLALYKPVKLMTIWAKIVSLLRINDDTWRDVSRLKEEYSRAFVCIKSQQKERVYHVRALLWKEHFSVSLSRALQRSLWLVKDRTRREILWRTCVFGKRKGRNFALIF